MFFAWEFQVLPDISSHLFNNVSTLAKDNCIFLYVWNLVVAQRLFLSFSTVPIVIHGSNNCRLSPPPMSYMYSHVHLCMPLGINWSKPFLRANHGIKVTFELTKHATAIWQLNHWKSRSVEGNISKKTWSQSLTFQGNIYNVSDYPLSVWTMMTNRWRYSALPVQKLFMLSILTKHLASSFPGAEKGEEKSAGMYCLRCA